MNKHIILPLLLALLMARHTSAEQLFEATYSGEYGNIAVTMVRSLDSHDGIYSLNSKAKSFMARIDEQSQFQPAKNTLQPLAYRYTRKVFGVNKQEFLDFDWKKLTANYRKGKDKGASTPITLTMLDPTLYQLQFQIDLYSKPNAPQYSYTFARRDQIKTYTFKKDASTTLSIEGKNYAVSVFSRIDEKNTQTAIWIIPELDYAIGKIIHTEKDGNAYQVLLTRYKSHPSFKQFLEKNRR